LTYPFGIDVSNNQGTISWDGVAQSGVQFAVAKVSEGASFQDAFFAKNWSEMARVGLVRGAYHFARPSRNTAATEATYFLQCLAQGGGLHPGDFVALDLEDDPSATDTTNFAQWAIDWLTFVGSDLGFRPLLYSRTDYLSRHGCLGNATLGQYGLWLASYGVATVAAPSGWDFWAIWQYNDKGSIPGVAGVVDLDAYNGPISQLPLYGAHAVWPVPAPPKPTPKTATNDDLEELHRLVDVQPFDGAAAAALIAYAEPFAGAAS